ncbi:hypothetical protein EPI10_024218 [Gossypium australe]|uniref:Uncharacterized protein n=1 Tax=Gossypium australe TaxID=47621 RepID=A0A5B6VXX4_9ROSI|nr:hypothetical protein EPI10_024218 [Gossypium australe]
MKERYPHLFTGKIFGDENLLSAGELWKKGVERGAMNIRPFIDGKGQSKRVAGKLKSSTFELDRAKDSLRLNKNAKLQNEITTFQQLDDESLYEA